MTQDERNLLYHGAKNAALEEYAELEPEVKRLAARLVSLKVVVRQCCLLLKEPLPPKFDVSTKKHWDDDDD